LKGEVSHCHSKKLLHPIECYKEARGVISYTAEDRVEWEKKNHGWHKGVHFEPESISKADMIKEEKKK
jgi:hypothetical protein